MATHFISSILSADIIIIHPVIQERALDPFTLGAARRFFGSFVSSNFEYAGKIGSILIYDGKENSPKHSYATGWIFRETPEEFDEIFNRTGDFPSRQATIHFEVGGTMTGPTIDVH